MAAVFSSIIVFGVVFLVVYFVRKKRTAESNSDNGNGIYPDKYYFRVHVVLKVANGSKSYIGYIYYPNLYLFQIIKPSSFHLELTLPSSRRSKLR